MVAFDLRETRHTLGESGVLVPCGDRAAFASAIAELAQDSVRRRRLIVAARERVAEFQWSRSVSALLNAYEQL